MTVFLVGGLNELDKLPCRRTRNHRLDNCQPHEVVRDIEETWEREQRIKRLMRITRKKLRKNGGA